MSLGVPNRPIELRPSPCTPAPRAAPPPHRHESTSRNAFRTSDGAIMFDPSGVVKGWAVERAAVHLETLPGTDFCLSAGGDLLCRTLNADAPPWRRIGIEDPRDPKRIIAVVPVRTGAVATSGTAYRGEHIVDA